MGASILIVEDDAFLAFDLAGVLTEAGFRVIGPAGSADKALSLLAETDCDAAVLDVNLGRMATSEPVAHELIARGKPFVAVTGYAEDQRPAIFSTYPVLNKPLRRGAIVIELHRLLSSQGASA